MIALALGASTNLAIPQIVRIALNSGTIGSIQSALPYFASILCGLFVLQATFLYVRGTMFGITGHRAVARLRKELFDGFLKRNVEFFEASRIQELVTRLASDCLLIQDAVSIRLSVLIRYSLQVIGGSLLMAWMSVRLTLLVLVCLPVIVLLGKRLGSKLRAQSKAVQGALGIASAVAEEALVGIRIVKAYNNEPTQHTRYSGEVDRVRALAEARTRASAFMQASMSLLMHLVIVAVGTYGLARIGTGEMTVGDLTAFTLYGAIVAVSFLFLVEGYTEILQSFGAAERVFEFLDEELPPDIIDHGDLDFSLPIRFEDVEFRYRSRPDTAAVTGISLMIPAGVTTALIGPSGAGKSTVVSLLLRFYEPGNGVISLGDVPLASISPRSWRSQIALVPQDPVFFNTSIAENLRIGDPAADIARLEWACAQANILEFVRQLPRGFETEVGDRGVRLSGGQKQRLAIARAFLKDPALLILDEATSALDNENDRLIQDAVKRLMAQRTCLIIAHRASTVQFVDHVICLHRGRIVQSGTPAELARVQGYYRDFLSMPSPEGSAA